jgi:hypothetical protein
MLPGQHRPRRGVSAALHGDALPSQSVAEKETSPAGAEPGGIGRERIRDQTRGDDVGPERAAHGHDGSHGSVVIAAVRPAGIEPVPGVARMKAL